MTQASKGEISSAQRWAQNVLSTAIGIWIGLMIAWLYRHTFFHQGKIYHWILLVAIAFLGSIIFPLSGTLLSPIFCFFKKLHHRDGYPWLSDVAAGTMTLFIVVAEFNPVAWVFWPVLAIGVLFAVPFCANIMRRND